MWLDFMYYDSIWLQRLTKSFSAWTDSGFRTEPETPEYDE